MKKIAIIPLLLLCSTLWAQKVPNFTFSENMANPELRGKKLTIQGKLVAVCEGRGGDDYFFLDKKPNKTLLIHVSNKGDYFDREAPKYVDNVVYYHFTPELLKKIQFESSKYEEGEYNISAIDDSVPYEEISENKIKIKRAGFGERDDEGYLLMGIQMFQIKKFKSKADFEKFKKEFLSNP